jgi:protoporphyrinogen oxidase
MQGKKVVILGAGPAGLSAGWKLSLEGVQVDILEKEAVVGGLSRSTRKDGFIFDLGGHRFITKDELVLAEIEALMGEELLMRSRKSVIRLQGKFFSYPLMIGDVLRKMKPSISLKTGVDLLFTKLGVYSKLPDISFEGWIIKRFGKTLYDLYFAPYSYKLWGIPSSQISSAWGPQRISLLNVTDVLLRALGKKKDEPRTYAGSFLYPKGGIGQIAERMSDQIEKKHGRIHLNSDVKKIIFNGKRIERIIYLQDGKEKDISADFIVSTIPLPEFILSLYPRVDDRYTATASNMAFRSIKFFHLMINREFITHDTWIYVPEEKYIFFRIQNRRNWSPTTVPPGQNALTLEIACNKNDAIWNCPDKEIFERCIKDLEDLKLVTREQVTGYFTETIENAYPVYTIDYAEKINIIYKLLANIESFISIGRQGLYRYNNMDHSIKMGILAAWHILRGYPRKKILEIATEHEIFDWQDFSYCNGA